MIKRTEKSKVNSRQKSKANSRQKSTANSRQEKIIANNKQSKPKVHDRDKTKYEEKQYRGKLQPVSDEVSRIRCRCPAGAMRAEAGWRNHDLPKVDFNEEIVENVNHPDSSEAATQKVQKTVKIPQIRDRQHSDAFFQLESRGSMKSAQ